jgi:hypothetical protein
VLEHVHDIGRVYGIVKTAISVKTEELNGAALERSLTNGLRGLLIRMASPNDNFRNAIAEILTAPAADPMRRIGEGITH